MTADRVRIAIVGCGKIAQTHAAALAEIPEAELVACCDQDEQRANDLASQYGVPDCTADLDGLLGSGKVDAILVCVPHPIHERVVVAAANAGVHALCEKPIATSLEEADRMISAHDWAGTTFGVIFQRRFWPAAQRIRQAIDSGRLGTPTFGECSARIWRSSEYFGSDPWRGKWATEGGGVLMNQAVHAIDQFLWFMGNPVEVVGRYATLVHGDYIDVEDTAVATVLFESGALGVINASSTFTTNLGFRVAINGSSGEAVSVWENPEGTQGVNELWTFAGEEELRLAWDQKDRGNPGFPGFHRNQIQEFVQSILAGRPPAVTGRDGLRSLEVILAIYESSRTGLPVQLPMQRSGVPIQP
ncbi:MAG TPA: Gfo/Idh/MocA family oxidoreductase [Thermomicrobiales bacterium]|nr:Gfo/Idh/MocA family oxidoreductase [Thermomicrobiales bacterium]